MNEKELEQEISQSTWPDEEHDVEELKKMIPKNHPDGFIGTAILNLPENFPDDPDAPISIGLNPTYIQISRYFSNKYDKEKGQILFFKFCRKYLKLWEGVA